MSAFLSLLGPNAAAVGLLVVCLWLWSLVRRDVSIVDPWWSMGTLLIAAVTGWGHAWSLDHIVVFVVVALWAVRLWAYLGLRSIGHPEDARYTAFRNQFGPQRYWWVSFFQVFLLQGFLMLVVSAPLQAIMRARADEGLPINVIVGAGLAFFGLVFEAVADAQLAAFKKIVTNRGKVLDSGLWRYSRHPNYFGEAVVAWGFWICALHVPGGTYTIFAPLIMTWLLLRVSGVTMLEKNLRRSKPAYADYEARTSTFVPWPPKKTISG